MRTIKFGIIGCGLMGREFASAAARWCHLLESKARPEIVAICDINESLYPWYTENFSSITQVTADYHALLANPAVEAIYCALPHSMHADVYTDIIKAGKHLLGEKPFGVDREANQTIVDCVESHPEVVVRSSSEFPFFPGVQRIVNAYESGAFGEIIEIEGGFLHSSDINPNKAINWKRMIDVNGEYGCMGDLGLHVLHVPLRLGWQPESVYAQLTNLVTERPSKDGMVPCETWDNANMHCRVNVDGKPVPMTCKTWRIAPGETDTWYIKVLGMKQSMYYTTKAPKTLATMTYEPGGAQTWHHEDLGYTPLFPCITGGIFEFGFTDAILQMWAAFLDELNGGDANGFGCATVNEAAQSHAVFTAALQSHSNNKVAEVLYEAVAH